MDFSEVIQRNVAERRIVGEALIPGLESGELSTKAGTLYLDRVDVGEVCNSFKFDVHRY